MPVKITDHSKRALARYDKAARLGVSAASNVLVREVKKAFGSDYYKGGAFRSTLYVKQSVRRSDPEKEADGWAARVGTNKIQALYWELGHQNVFTRRFERVRIWEPTALANITTMREAFASVVKRIMGQP